MQQGQRDVCMSFIHEALARFATSVRVHGVLTHAAWDCVSSVATAASLRPSIKQLPG